MESGAKPRNFRKLSNFDHFVVNNQASQTIDKILVIGQSKFQYIKRQVDQANRHTGSRHRVDERVFVHK